MNLEIDWRKNFYNYGHAVVKMYSRQAGGNSLTHWLSDHYSPQRGRPPCWSPGSARRTRAPRAWACAPSALSTPSPTPSISGALGLELAMNGYNTSTDFKVTQYSCGASDWWSSPWLPFKSLTTTLSRIATSPFSRWSPTCGQCWRGGRCAAACSRRPPWRKTKVKHCQEGEEPLLMTIFILSHLFIVHSECASIYAPLLKNSNQHKMFAVESNPKLELTIASNEAIVEIQLCLTHIFMLRMCSKLSGENFNDPLSHPPAPFQQLHHSALNSTFFWKENTHSF